MAFAPRLRGGEFSVVLARIAGMGEGCGGIELELDGIDLGDRRLNKRSKKVIAALAVDSRASINAACGTWAETEAAYRFFDNDSVTPERILKPHRDATVRRMREQPVVLIVQDTTEFDFTDHPPSDAKCLNRAERRGFYDHTHLAVTPQGLALGVVGEEQFDRETDSLGKANERATLPIEEKESLRWLNGFRLANETAAACPDTQIVSVADREADIYDIFVEAHQQSEHAGPRAEFLIRARVERCLTERDPNASGATYLKVRATVAASPLLGTRVVDLPRTPKRDARRAVMEVRAMSVLVKPPHARSHLPAVTMQVVLVKEVGGPGDGTDVEWLLLTSLPITTFEQALLVIDDYVGRWMIEVFFRTLKTGCTVEEMRLEKLSRVKNCLAFYKIIAVRILSLTYLNRVSPDLPCDAVFDASEWKSVWRVVTKQPLPKQPPRLADFIKLVASLGGYNNRPSDPPPGPQTLWLGTRRMLDYAQAWKSFGPDAHT